MSEFGELARYYGLPARNPDQPRPVLRAAAPWRMAAPRLRRRRRRRLAYLDSTFPWERSGFRYHEALAIRNLRPDTMFFSLWELNDPFPSPVYPLADFPVIAPAAGITDAYAVFQLFLAGLCGLNPSGSNPPNPFEGPDLTRVLRRAGIRLHGSIYAGGGFTVTEHGLAEARAIAERLTTTFSYVPEMLEGVAGVTPEAGAWTETEFYAQSSERWDRPRPLVCLFAADRARRKGMDVVIRAFAELDADDFHLHVAGPHEHRRDELPHDIATFHGWCTPAQLRDLHRQSHVFVSPVSVEAAGPAGSFMGVVDGFPTQAARDAMSSGCLLVSANPQSDHRVLQPGIHYVDCMADAATLRATLLALRDDRVLMRRVATAGSDRVRDQFDVRRGAAFKLSCMGLLPERPRRA